MRPFPPLVRPSPSSVRSSPHAVRPSPRLCIPFECAFTQMGVSPRAYPSHSEGGRTNCEIHQIHPL